MISLENTILSEINHTQEIKNCVIFLIRETPNINQEKNKRKIIVSREIFIKREGSQELIGRR